MKDWLDEYFGEDYLTLYYFSEERTAKEADFIEKILRARIFTENTLNQQLKVLDLACGQGRHAIKLAEQGFKVLGIDYQEGLLDIARKNCAEQAKNTGNIAFLQGDMRELAYSSEFDAVLNLFTAFGYFDDETNHAVVGKIAAAIKRNGIFFQDLANKEYQLRETKPAWERITHNGLKVDNVWTFNERTKQYTHKQWLHKENGQIREFSHTVRIYDFFEIEEIYSAHGLEILDVYGDYDGNSYDKSSSPRMIVIAKRL